MKESSQYNLPSRFVRLITFVDLPIKLKFRLFSIGVLFWFMVMAALTVAGMVGINMRYDKIVNHAVPQDKVVQKVIRNLQSMTIDSSNMLKAGDHVTVERLQDLSSKRLRDVRDFSSALALGGAVNDYSHDSGKLLETLHTTSLSIDPEGVTYLKALNLLLDEIDMSYKAFFQYKLQVLDQKAPNVEHLEGRYKTLEGYINRPASFGQFFIQTF